MVALEAFKVFSRLAPGEIEKVRSVARTSVFKKGQNIFKEGDPGDGIFLVRSGEVRISGTVTPGQEIDFGKVMPGEMLGEMAAVDSRPRSASACAEKDTELYFIGREDLMSLLQAAPRLAISLMQEISARLRDFNRQYLRNVVQAERLATVGQFANSIVHDLKNPLTIINMAVELGCGEDSKPEIRREAREQIHKQVSRITLLVNDVLEFTRGSPAAVQLTAQDYAEILRAFVNDVTSELAAREVYLKSKSEPTPVTVHVNRQRLTRVLHNLVSNAVDAMPKGGVIHFDFEQTNGEVITRVIDSGKGIAPEIADRLFEPFATHGKASGSGLGLSICQRIVEEHGGKITAANNPEGGAVFTFTLPRK